MKYELFVHGIAYRCKKVFDTLNQFTVLESIFHDLCYMINNIVIDNVLVREYGATAHRNFIYSPNHVGLLQKIL